MGQRNQSTGEAVAKLISAILCNRVIIDQQNNLVSYIDVLDGVTIASFPIKAPLTIVGTIWQVENEKKFEVKVRIFDPAGLHLMDSALALLNLDPGTRKARINIAVVGFDINAAGTYQFAIEQKISGKWQEISRIPMDIYSSKEAASTN